MLTGIALSRRTGDFIMAPPAFTAEAGFEALFDGRSLGDWMSTISNQPGRNDPGPFRVRRGVLEARTGSDLGLLWLTRPTPASYVLRLQWMMTAIRPLHRTGAVYSFKGATDGPVVVHPVGEWNDYEITVDGSNITVVLNG